MSCIWFIHLMNIHQDQKTFIVKVLVQLIVFFACCFCCFTLKVLVSIHQCVISGMTFAQPRSHPFRYATFNMEELNSMSWMYHCHVMFIGCTMWCGMSMNDCVISLYMLVISHLVLLC